MERLKEEETRAKDKLAQIEHENLKLKQTSNNYKEEQSQNEKVIFNKKFSKEKKIYKKFLKKFLTQKKFIKKKERKLVN